MKQLICKGAERFHCEAIHIIIPTTEKYRFIVQTDKDISLSLYPKSRYKLCNYGGSSIIQRLPRTNGPLVLESTVPLENSTIYVLVLTYCPWTVIDGLSIIVQDLNGQYNKTLSSANVSDRVTVVGEFCIQCFYLILRLHRSGIDMDRFLLTPFDGQLDRKYVSLS